MGTTIQISHVRSRSPSVASDDDPYDTGARVSAPISPQYSTTGSVRGGQSQSGSSEHREEDIVHLSYPHEVPEPELRPSDSASRLAEPHRLPLEPTRSTSLRREPVPRRRAETRDPGRPPARDHPRDSPTESNVSSAEEFARQPYHPSMPRPQSYYGNNGYAYSHSSDSYGQPMGPPPNNQMIHYAAPPPQPVPYAPHYSHMGPPSHHGYAPSVHSYMPPMIHQAPSHMTSPYSNSPYMSPMGPYGPPGPGYFPPQYPQPFQPHAPYMDPWRVQSPTQSVAPQPAPAPAPTAPSESQRSADTDELAKKIEAMLLDQKSQALKNEAERENIIRAAKEEAQAQAERLAYEQRIREEAVAAALKQAADAAAAERERAAAEAKREQQIREEAAAAARQAIADEAAANAAKAAAEQKIAEDAAKAAREEAEGKAAEAKKAADEKQEEAEKKLKEAEKAAAEAKEAAEKAAADAAANAPPEKKAPIMFHDAYNRSYKLPFELCAKWRQMEHMIHQAHQGFDAAELVMQHRYDLLGPSGEVIMPHVWESIVEPGWDITLKPWPMPEPPPPEPEPEAPPPLDDSILTLDDILNPKKKPSKGGGSKKKSGRGGLASWMAGGVSTTKGGKALKDDKKPDIAADPQHGAPEQGSCAIM